MSNMNVRLPDTFVDAKRMIEDSLENKKLSLKTYGAMFSNLADVTLYHIAEVEDEEGYANLDLLITYKYRTMGLSGGFEVIEKTKKLKVLNSIGDSQWTFRMITKVWDGDYPSTVAVDMETGEVFLFSLKMNRIELTEFGKLTETQFEVFKYELNDREPFRIRLNADAMFEFIDGAEGLNHLQKSVFVEFSCGMPIVVENKRTSVL
jgi:hypothetical protein